MEDQMKLDIFHMASCWNAAHDVHDENVLVLLENAEGNVVIAKLSHDDDSDSEETSDDDDDDDEELPAGFSLQLRVPAVQPASTAPMQPLP